MTLSSLFPLKRWLKILPLLLSLGLLSACAMTMADQPRYEPLEASRFFADGASARPRVADTVARGQLHLGTHLTTGRVDGRFVDAFPFDVTLQTLQRGEERFEIFCTPCHGLLGDGTGIVTQYGMPQPDSFHTPDLRDQPAGYYFAIITDGTRVMPGYASRIGLEDRWAIVAYIRALQLSQNADPNLIPPAELPKLEQGKSR